MAASAAVMDIASSVDASSVTGGSAHAGDAARSVATNRRTRAANWSTADIVAGAAVVDIGRGRNAGPVTDFSAWWTS